MRSAGRHWLVVALAVGIAGALVPAPAGASTRATTPAEPARPLQRLGVGPAGGPRKVAQIVDQQGRQVLLRGVNVDGLVDYFQPNLKAPYPLGPASYAHGACPADDPAVEGVVLCSRDFTQLRALGYDAIRLNLSWSLLEPAPGRIDPTYIDRIAQVVGWARQAAIYVILDMHQDAWSKYLYSTPRDNCAAPYRAIRGYDGAPAWASLHRQPVCALGGVRELDPAVEEDFAKFFNDGPAPDGVGLREHYTSVLVALARRFHNDPTVAGYELINEPAFFAVPGTDSSVLLPFYAKVIGVVVSRVAGFRQLFFIEPGVTRNVTDVSNITVRWSTLSPYRNLVYAPHVYTRTFTPATYPMDGGYRSAISDAQRLGLPLWIGEFGNSPAQDRSVLRVHYQEQDGLGLGGTMWPWKENANDTNPSTFWGVYGPPFGPGKPQPERIKLTSRAYPLYTAGQLQTLSYDPDGHRLGLSATAHRVRLGDLAQATVIFCRAPAADRCASAEVACASFAAAPAAWRTSFPPVGATACRWASSYKADVGGVLPARIPRL